MKPNLTSRRCTSWCCHAPNPVKSVKDRRAGLCDAPPCKMLDGAATWMVNGVASVFFTSLRRCACVSVETKDDTENSCLSPLVPHGGQAKSEDEETGIAKNVCVGNNTV
ncbi:hypothetical protein K2173_014732 [Erythroxylum novogranatense]|uniref:Uncharacterized protein n=1 Tax=Erythroxylum novogranatense TaxID=1862640 RepID=A0AAV8TFJ3_9ROSI|nr:hypothetical protein K2173_014732 [Erythroxylum novogranatense]